MRSVTGYKLQVTLILDDWLQVTGCVLYYELPVKGRIQIIMVL